VVVKNQPEIESKITNLVKSKAEQNAYYSEFEDYRDEDSTEDRNLNASDSEDEEFFQLEKVKKGQSSNPLIGELGPYFSKINSFIARCSGYNRDTATKSTEIGFKDLNLINTLHIGDNSELENVQYRVFSPRQLIAYLNKLVHSVKSKFDYGVKLSDQYIAEQV
jgi:hypothetical protein